MIICCICQYGLYFWYTLACTECKERNYITTKNRRNTPDRLELKKFCSRCGKQTVHRETR